MYPNIPISGYGPPPAASQSGSSSRYNNYGRGQNNRRNYSNGQNYNRNSHFAIDPNIPSPRPPQPTYDSQYYPAQNNFPPNIGYPGYTNQQHSYSNQIPNGYFQQQIYHNQYQSLYSVPNVPSFLSPEVLFKSNANSNNTIVNQPQPPGTENYQVHDYDDHQYKTKEKQQNQSKKYKDVEDDLSNEEIPLYTQYNIRLDTPEDIAKWIEERKKRYPTDSNIQKKKEEARLAKERRVKRKIEEDDEANDSDVDDSEDSDSESKSKTSFCKYYQQGNCRHGEDCTFKHEIQPPKKDGTENNSLKFVQSNGLNKSGKRRMLLKMLLAPEIFKERAIVMQCIRHIVKNKFFDKNAAIEDEIDSIISVEEAKEQFDMDVEEVEVGENVGNEDLGLDEVEEGEIYED
ncbi:hypothetical protein HK098_001864 [Nowakowskiella sp. JEL0407]|nr:hypothetical protein HK098_001859 [Nowakowskiella sp. JEL0407]KAJ3123517.1 hypothetical protein HK098_001864 [Nowakowskiella sp. JEL0407]